MIYHFTKLITSQNGGGAYNKTAGGIQNLTTYNNFDNSPDLISTVYYWAYVVITSPKAGDGSYYYLESSVVPVEMPLTPANGQIIFGGAAGVGAFDGKTWTFVPVPEPATLALVGIGVVAIGLRRRR